MKNKKIFMYLIIIFIISFIIYIGIILVNNKKTNKNIIEELTPMQEISEEQLRYTNITIFFYNKKNDQFEPEIVQIDSKTLLNDPERVLIKYLLLGSTNRNLTNLFPENTNLIDSKIVKNSLYLSFSEEFEQITDDNKEKIKKEILLTVSQLKEIDSVYLMENNN